MQQPSPTLRANVGYIHTAQFLSWIKTGAVPNGWDLKTRPDGTWYLERGDTRLDLVVTDNADRSRELPCLVPTPSYLESVRRKSL